LWNVEVDSTELQQLGARLGADVPFFFFGGRGIARGTGSEVTIVSDDEKRHLIVVTPNAKVSTAEAYASLKATALTTSKDDTILSSFRAVPDLELSRLCTAHTDF